MIDNPQKKQGEERSLSPYLELKRNYKFDHFFNGLRIINPIT